MKKYVFSTAIVLTGFFCSFMATNSFAQTNSANTDFGETLHSLVAMSDANSGFDSLTTGKKISAGGYQEVDEVSVVLPGAKASFLSSFDQSYVAWFGAFPTLQQGKAKVTTLSKQILEALGESHQQEDDYVEAKKGTFMRFFRFESERVRSSALVSLELAFFDNKYQIRLSIPNQSPTYYNLCSFYVVTPTPEYEAFKSALNTLMGGVSNQFANLRGQQTDENFTQGKIYSLKTNLPGMKCVAGEKALGLNKEYCTCLSEQTFHDFSEYNMPHTIFMEQLIFALQPLGYAIGTTTGNNDESFVMSISKPRANGIVKEKAVVLYLKELSSGQKIGISIRDIE